MRKERIEFDSPVDALVHIAKRLSLFESRYHMTSEEFSKKYLTGGLEDSIDFVEWANDYQHFIAIRQDIEGQLRNVA